MTAATLSLDDAIGLASTGDIWLFRGRSLADRTIRAVTNSPVNHVGMVVALEDLPPLLWHAEMGRSLPDVWTGERHRGVQLHLLADAVRTWEERYRQRAWMRPLSGTIERGHEDRLLEVIARFDGRPFPTTPGLVRQWLTGRLRRHTSLETVYCAELVATTYQRMGLLRPAGPRAGTTRGGSGAATGSTSSRRSRSRPRSRCGDAHGSSSPSRSAAANAGASGRRGTSVACTTW